MLLLRAVALSEPHRGAGIMKRQLEGPCDIHIKVSRAKPGTIHYYSEVASLPPGPTSLNQLVCWPADVVRTLFHDGTEQGRLRLSRLHHFVRVGVVCSTDYSGKGGPEMMFSMMVRALQMPFFRSYYACDISSVCQQVLLTRTDRPAHVFPSLHSRLPQEAQAALRDMAPPPAVDKDTAKLAYARIGGLPRQQQGRVLQQHVYF